MTQPEKSYTDVQRSVGDHRIEIRRKGQPVGWALLHVYDINGTVLFSGVLEEADVPMETVVALERGRAYNRACAAAPNVRSA